MASGALPYCNNNRVRLVPHDAVLPSVLVLLPVVLLVDLQP